MSTLRSISVSLLFVLIAIATIGGCEGNGLKLGPGFTRNPNIPDNVETIKDCGPNKKQCSGPTSDCVPLDTVCCSLTANFDSVAQICGNRCINKELICCDEDTKAIFCSQDKPICCPIEDFPFPGPSCTETLELCNCLLPMFADFNPDIPVCDESVFPILNASSCFTYEEIIESECPAELVFKTCEPYECIECTELDCYQTNTFFPYSFTGCEIIDCNTIDCDQDKNIHVDGELRWIEFIDGVETEATCF